eukprot:CAMPEP_0182441280 /NCGR_PEP_ID=MMETSP1172-20130603/217_1 /TAXON_ID=708627 /ORGANISM="Timspurckia oligopyrenoides, Strain CCMP3278" /LENGTH=926 /DNA_ID=CAMNT_0024635461 /DNA_START=38 /DNA_END=2818 /DNA_ORIENTATION=-
MVNSHGEFLREWESDAPLNEVQSELCLLVETHTSSAFGIQTIKTQTDHSEKQNNIQDKSVEATNSLDNDEQFQLESVRTADDFRRWHEFIERKLAETNEIKYTQMVESLKHDEHIIDQILESVESALVRLQNIKQVRSEVLDTTIRFRSDCESLVAERHRFSELADALRRRLNYFEELETLSVKFGSGKDAIHPTHSEFIPLLHRLDECVAYASSSTGAVAEADGYLARFLELQRRAFSMIRNYTITLIRSTTTQVLKEIRSEGIESNDVGNIGLSDASKEYLRFRTIAPRVKSLIAELSARAQANVSKNIRDIVGRADASALRLLNNPLFSSRSVAMSLLSECEEVFIEQRRRLIEPVVLAYIKSLADSQNMIGLARTGALYVLQVCELERSLFEYFFLLKSESLSGWSSESSAESTEVVAESSDQKTSSALFVQLRGLCEFVYEELRPRILQETDVDKLAYLVEVLKMEVLADEIPRRGLSGEAMSLAVYRTIADAQERLIYRAEVYLRDQIKGFTPNPVDLEYPELLMYSKGTFKSEKSVDTSADTTLTANGKDLQDIQQIESARERRRNARGHFATWYPPVELTLRLLSLLYRCVDSEVFAGIAQEAVGSCVQSLLAASQRIAKRPIESADEHSQLFLIWQLLMLREQISPFDVEFAYMEKELDFYELRQLLGQVVRGHVSFRSLAQPPAAMKVRTVDSKRDLEKELRAICETFILRKTRLVLDPILAFLAKCNALPSTVDDVSSRSRASARMAGLPKQDTNRNEEQRSGDKEDDNEMSAGLDSVIREVEEERAESLSAFDALKKSSSSFAHPANLKLVWEQVSRSVRNELPESVARMHIYITKPSSRAVLLRPLHANFAEATRELLSTLQARYTIEEREFIGINGEKVTELLDEIDMHTSANRTSNATRSSTTSDTQNTPE